MNRESKYEKPDEIWPIPFEMIKPVPDEGMYLKDYDSSPVAVKLPILLPTWQIVHFKTYNPNNRFVGLSHVGEFGDDLRGNLGMRSHKNTAVHRMRRISGRLILAFKDWIADDAWKDIKRENETVRQCAMK